MLAPGHLDLDIEVADGYIDLTALEAKYAFELAPGHYLFSDMGKLCTNTANSHYRM